MNDDVASPEFRPMVERAKDVAAGSSLLSAIGAVFIGLLVFDPRLLALFSYSQPMPPNKGLQLTAYRVLSLNSYGTMSPATGHNSQPSNGGS